MTIQNQKKFANHVFRLLKVSEIVVPIGRTNKGNLGVKFTSGNEDFEVYLDAVPLPIKDALNDDNNIELKKVIEKYLFEQIQPTFQTNAVLESTLYPKKRGRPSKKK